MSLLQRPFLLETTDWVAVALTAADAPALQAFFDTNPLYSEIINHRPFQPDEALDAIVTPPPFPHRAIHAWAVLQRHSGRWLGFVSLVDDLMAPGVCHIGLFLVATEWHGSGLASALYAEVERRARSQGALWMRLGVVVGNARAERFWSRLGFQELRQRHGMPYEGPSTSVRVLVKPLGASTVLGYLAQVARDRPESP